MELYTFAAAGDFVSASVARIKEAVGAAAPSQGYIALSGGSTPLPVYQALASDPSFDVEQAEFFLVDERFVHRDHADSTYAMVVKAFAPAEPFFSDHFHFFDTTRPIAEALAAYETALENVPNGQFDLIILGIGKDGHTASLFPGGVENAATERAVHSVNGNAPQPPVRDRLTITWPVILAAKQILVLVSGKDKNGIVEELLNGKKSAEEFPPRRLTGHSSVTVHFLEN
jgi:6-phosphogluconolactonase